MRILGNACITFADSYQEAVAMLPPEEVTEIFVVPEQTEFWEATGAAIKAAFKGDLEVQYMDGRGLYLLWENDQPPIVRAATVSAVQELIGAACAATDSTGVVGFCVAPNEVVKFAYSNEEDNGSFVITITDELREQNRKLAAEIEALTAC